MKKLNKSGFTIVELLIVILVIGILAALVLMAYGNIQGRAQASVTKNIVQQYTKALMTYKVDKGSYPTPDDLSAADLAGYNGGGICIGTGYSNGCGTNFNASEELPSFHALLEPYTGNTPNISPHDVPIVIDPENGVALTVKGITYYFGHADDSQDFLDGADIDFIFLVYALDEPNAQCTGGEVLSQVADGFIRDQAKNTLTDGTNTACVLLLEDSIVD